MTRPLTALVSLALLTLSTTASAQSVEDALTHYREGRIQEALAAFERVRESATEDPTTLVTTHVYLGVIHAAMGDEPLARRDFAVALALDPELSAPSELSPALRRVFDEVREGNEALTLAVEAPEAPTVGEAVEVTVAAEHVPAHVVAAIRVRAIPAEGEPWVGRVEGISGTVTIPASAWAGGAELRVVAEALTTHAGVLARQTRPLRGTLPGVAAAAAPAEGPAEDGGGGSVAEEAWFWILIGTLVLGGAAAAILIPTVGTQDVYELGAPEIVRM